MTLSLYIARKFGWMFTRVFLGFFGMMLLLDILDEMRRFSDPGISFGQAAQLSSMNVPESIYRIMPLIMILTAIALFMGLARSSELVVVRSVGRSGLRFLLTPFLCAVAIGVLSVAVFNPIVAATMKRYDVLWSRYAHGAESVLSVSAEGLWLRQGGPDGQTVIHATRATADGTDLFGATFLSFDAKGLPQERIAADKATLTPGSWTLTNAKRWPLASTNPESDAKTEATTTLPSELTRDAIRDSFGKPSAIPIYQLPDYIAGLERAGFSARNHRVWFQMELALPLLLASVVLVAAGFTMRPARSGKVGIMVLFALLSGFAIFFLRNFAQILGENGQIPILMAAWAPPVATTLFAVGLLLHLEDG